MSQHAVDQFTSISKLRTALRRTGLSEKARLKLTTDLVDAYTALVNNLIIQADTDPDGRLPYIVVRLQGVDVSARERPGDPSGEVLIQIEDTRGDDDRRTHPLVVNVNNTGERRYT